MHKLLERQLRKSRLETGELDVDSLLKAVCATYEDADNDRRRTERSITLMIEELDRSHAQLRDAIDVIPESLVLSDANGRVVIWNQKFAELYPYAADLLKPGAAFDQVIRAGMNKSPEPLVESWLTNRSKSVDQAGIAIRLTNNRWLRVEECTTQDGDTITVFVDISDLKQREEWFRLLFDNNPVPMWVHDRFDLTVLAANKAAQDYLGYSSDELMKRTILDVKPESERSETRARASSDVDFYTVRNARYLTADGREVTADIFSRCIEYAGREARIVNAVDTTERQRAEAAKEAALAEAERLRIQEQAAAQANKAKSSFLAVMSHEIRTPLNAVLGLATSLLDGSLSEDQRQQIRTIYDAGDGLLEILNDILDYSKLEAGHVTLDLQPFEVDHFVRTVVSIAAPKATAKNLALISQIDSRLPAALLGDASRLRQVIVNFVSNAIKFTEHGEVRLDVAIVGEKDGDPIIEWKVTDTGIGIDREQIKRLFADYVQADTTINRRFGGTGLGLAISKRIVDQMSGETFISSELGRGTVVGCRVPMRSATMTAFRPYPQQTASTRDDLQSVLARSGRRMSLLIVDDNTTNRLVATKLLGDLPLRLDTAANGLEAVAAAAKHAYDGILMDMRMPEMDGLEATRAIRASGGPSAGCAIIAFTANAFADDIEECIQSGMDDFISKPVRKQHLHAVLAKALTARHRTRPSQQDAPADVLADDAGFDPAQIAELEAEVGLDGVEEMISSFLLETEQRLTVLKQVAQSPAGDQLTREAHTIKGSASIFGAVALAEAARQLEFAAKSGCDDVEARRLADIIDRRFHAAKTILRNKIAA